MKALYHGSVHQIKTPQFGFGKRNNDYGMGFYCTESPDLAKEWAVARDHDGWANRYELDERQDFISGAISYSQLCAAMRLGKLGNQYVLKSEKAFAAIVYQDAALATREEWLVRKEARDRAARSEYLNELRVKRIPGDLRIDRIIDEEIKADDPCLR